VGKLKKHDEFISNLRIKNKKMYDELEFLTEYEYANQYILAMTKYGTIRTKPSKLLSGRGYTIESAVNKTEFWINKAIEVHGSKYDYSLVDYVGNKKEVTIICKTHGEFKQKSISHLLGYGCRKCGTSMGSLKQLKSNSEFIKELKSRQPKLLSSLKNIGKYEGYNNNILVEDDFGKLKTTPCRLLAGKLPNIKSAVNKTEYFKSILKYKRGSEYDYSEVKYVDSETKITIICKKHGEFTQLPYNHLGGQDCPHCRESKMESKIRIILNDENIGFIQEHTFEDCKNKGRLIFDFYVPSVRVCIEADGIQHFEPIEFFGGENGFLKTKVNDEIKTEYCEKNGITLIRIPYFKFDDIEEILIREVINK